MVENIVYRNRPVRLTPVINPVSKINHKLLKNPGPGPVIRKLQRAWSGLVGVDIVAQALSQLDTSMPAGRIQPRWAQVIH